MPPPPAGRPHWDSSGSEISRYGFSADLRGALNASQRPSQPPQGNNLLFLFFVQDIAHIDGGYRPPVRVNVLSVGLSLAGFQVIMYGRFWVITEGCYGKAIEGNGVGPRGRGVPIARGNMFETEKQ